MKNKLIVLTGLVLTTSLYSQVIFGDKAGTAANKTSVLMEFPSAGNRGIIMPYVTNRAAITTPGSIIMDATTPTAAKVKYYNGTTWVDLSVQPANISSAITIQPPASENSNAKVVIGNSTSAADGILVLESTTKAMLMPITTSIQNIVNPAPGTMTIVNNSGILSLAVYNGTQWSFWSYQ